MTVKSSAVCDALHERVVPAIAAMRENDFDFERGSTFMLNAAYYEFVGEFEDKPHVGIEMMPTETEEDAIAQNIITIDTLLADPRDVTTPPSHDISYQPLVASYPQRETRSQEASRADSEVQRAARRLPIFAQNRYYSAARSVASEQLREQAPHGEAARLIFALNQACK